MCEKAGHFAANCPRKQDTFVSKVVAERNKKKCGISIEGNFQKHDGQAVPIDTANDQFGSILYVPDLTTRGVYL